MADEVADLVIRRYSTSFGLASRLLAGDVRVHVRNVYAMVRVADELVDAPRPDGDAGQQALLLDGMHADVCAALRTGHSANLVVHAFARTARHCGIGADLVDPFFASMQMDLERAEHDAASFAEYVYGSAEVVGLMCLKAFLVDEPDPQARYVQLSEGARRLGAAFQKVNFLRDLAQDHDHLGRTYFPDFDITSFDEHDRDRLLDDIDADLAAAAVAVVELPSSSRRAVAAAHALFAELAQRLRDTPPSVIRTQRVRVPGPRKAQIIAQAVAKGGNVTMTAATRGKVCVVGGGIAGLATAALLAQDGWDVELLEQHAELGGRAGSWSAEGFRFDTGPSWYLMPDVFEHFFALMGTSAAEQLDLRLLDPGYRVFFEGHEQPLEVSAVRAENVARFEALEPGAGQALEAYLDSADEAYAMAVDHFLYTSFEEFTSLASRRVLLKGRRLAPLLLKSLESFVAARFDDPRIRQVLGYPAVFLGSSPDRVPALYHLMSRMDLADGVLYPQGGFSTLVDAVAGLAREAGATLRTQVEVTAVLTEPPTRRGARATVRGVSCRDASGQERVVEADVVVGSCDLHHLETRMLPAELQTYPERWWARRDPGPGAVLVMLGVRGELPELAHHTMFFTRDWAANFDDVFDARQVPDPASSYVCRPSATDPSVAPQGHENLFVLVPVPADVALGHGGVDGSGDAAVEQVADAAVAQVAAWAGVPDLADRVVVRRTVGPADFAADLNAWSGGALGPGHVLTQSAFFRAGNASTKVDGLLYAGSSTIPGIGLPMCLISAELVLKRLRGDRSTGRVAAPITKEAAR
ncbi:phytoene desaturase family protein [Nocardioides daphniae]|uniref:phytoene desaturase family protein n=1 Tax=Nocardioides daphniae TaxID=402297 RepID=UPI0019310510|nr:phytoene desaturase family protein [Nocardioides daphniae]